MRHGATASPAACAGGISMNVQRLIFVAISLGLSLAGAHGAALAQQTIPPAITTNANGDCVTYGSPGDWTITCGDLGPGSGLMRGDSTGRGGYRSRRRPRFPRLQRPNRRRTRHRPRTQRQLRTRHPPLSRHQPRTRRLSRNPRRRPRPPWPPRSIRMRTTTPMRWNRRRGSIRRRPTPMPIMWPMGTSSTSTRRIRPSPIPMAMGPWMAKSSSAATPILCSGMMAARPVVSPPRAANLSPNRRRHPTLPRPHRAESDGTGGCRHGHQRQRGGVRWQADTALPPEGTTENLSATSGGAASMERGRLGRAGDSDTGRDHDPVTARPDGSSGVSEAVPPVLTSENEPPVVERLR